MSIPLVTDSADLDKIIKNLEFDNQQSIKLLEKENEQIKAIEKEIEEKKAAVIQLKESTSHLDEETKLLHKQFTLNRDSCDSLKKTCEVLIDHEEAVNKKVQLQMQCREDERKEHKSVIEHYEQIWRDYQATYETFKLAKVLKQKQEEANQLRSHLQAISEKVMNFKTILCQAKGTSDFEPFKTLNDFVKKFAEIKVDTNRKQADMKHKQQELMRINSAVDDIQSKIKEEETRLEAAQQDKLAIQNENATIMEEEQVDKRMDDGANPDTDTAMMDAKQTDTAMVDGRQTDTAMMDARQTDTVESRLNQTQASPENVNSQPAQEIRNVQNTQLQENHTVQMPQSDAGVSSPSSQSSARPWMLISAPPPSPRQQQLRPPQIAAPSTRPRSNMIEMPAVPKFMPQSRPRQLTTRGQQQYQFMAFLEQPSNAASAQLAAMSARFSQQRQQQEKNTPQQPLITLPRTGSNQPAGTAPQQNQSVMSPPPQQQPTNQNQFGVQPPSSPVSVGQAFSSSHHVIAAQPNLAFSSNQQLMVPAMSAQPHSQGQLQMSLPQPSQAFVQSHPVVAPSTPSRPLISGQIQAVSRSPVSGHDTSAGAFRITDSDGDDAEMLPRNTQHGSESPRTPGESRGKSQPTSPFDLEKHLNHIKELTKSPGYSFSSRPMYTADQQQNGTAEGNEVNMTPAPISNNNFLQPFMGTAGLQESNQETQYLFGNTSEGNPSAPQSTFDFGNTNIGGNNTMMKSQPSQSQPGFSFGSPGNEGGGDAAPGPIFSMFGAGTAEEGPSPTSGGGDGFNFSFGVKSPTPSSSGFNLF